MSAPQIVTWAIEAIIASSILMLAVLLLRGPIRRAFGPNIAYMLWALPALRMLLPPLPSHWREESAASSAIAPLAQAGETVTVYVIEPLGRAAAAPAASTPTLAAAIAALWCIGAAGFFLFHTISHRRFVARMIADSVREEDMGDIRVIETDAAAGPLAFGVLRKYVAFPRDFDERYDASERDLALAHELNHHARGDLIANWIALGLLAVHWFNPIAWRAFRAFRADQEMANDATVLAGRDPIARHTYACAIVKSAHGGAVSAACHLHTINDLKGRLRMLSTSRKSRARIAAGAATIALTTLTGLGFTASGSQAAERIRTKVSDTLGVELPAPALALHLPRALTPTAALAPVAAMVQAAAPMSPTAPTPPAMAQAGAPPAPPAPPTPPSMSDNDDDAPMVSESTGPDGKKVRTVIIRRHGAPPVNQAEIDARVREAMERSRDAMARAPQVSERKCPGEGNMTINESKDGKHRIIICTNRIERMSEQATRRAMDGVNVAMIERHARMSALDGVRHAREGILADRNLSDEARREALQGIDEAIAELEADQKK